MLGPDVLDVNRFPEIRFDSTTVAQTQSDRWTVRGQLTLHGQTRAVTINVVRTQEHFNGTVSFQQSAFGITPISIAAGSVKVKDDVSIAFDVVTRAHATPER
jgi:polyisoprenoid-binding protein YceI